MARVPDRRAAAADDPPWLNPAESLAQARDDLRADHERENRRQGMVLRGYLAASILHAVLFAVYFASLDEPVQRLAAYVSLGAGAVLAAAFIADLKGYRDCAAVASQMVPVVPVLIFAWIFSVEAGFGSYLFIGALGLVVLVPENRQRTRFAGVAVLVAAVLFLQFTFTRERALAPLSVTETTALATFNRTVMSLSLFTLALALNRSVRAARDLVRSNLALARTEADSDVLTGLPNRRPTWERVKNLVESQIPFTLALVDVDHFKRLNDQFGHECGDATLRRLGRDLAAAVREQDLVGRWGGEEFLLVFAGDHEGAAQAIARVHSEVSGLTAECGEQSIAVHFSMGYARWVTGDDPWKTLRRADHALYAAKRAGRNCIVADDPEQDILAGSEAS